MLPAHARPGTPVRQTTTTALPPKTAQETRRVEL
jgi:hypothetical protein